MWIVRQSAPDVRRKLKKETSNRTLDIPHYVLSLALGALNNKDKRVPKAQGKLFRQNSKQN